MRTALAAASLALLLACSPAAAETLFAPFVDEDGPNMLVWDPGTGRSRLYVFGEGWTVWDEEKQLPRNPVELQPGDGVRFAPYVDKDGKDNVIAWNTRTGKSKLFIFDGSSWVPWDEEKQLPPAPLGEAAYRFDAYRDKAGNDNVLVSDTASGRCRFFVYENGLMAPWAEEKQPPQNPLGLEPGAGETFLAPYADEDGDNLLAYDTRTGRSKLFLFGGEKWGPWDDDKQLPAAPVPVGKNESCLLVPYVDLEGGNNLAALNLATGQTKFFLFDDGWSAWDDDKQLPPPAPGDRPGPRRLLAPFVDSDGDSLLVFHPDTGASKLYLLGGEGWSEWDAEKQLPQNPLGG